MITFKELANDFARLTASHNSDSARTALIERLRSTNLGEAERALLELTDRLQRIVANSKGVEKQEAKRILNSYFGGSYSNGHRVAA